MIYLQIIVLSEFTLAKKRVHFSSASYQVKNFTQIKDYIITILYVSEQVTM